MTDFEQQLKSVLSQAYDIERELGGGGMSRVFVATDRVLGRKIVIKLLSPELTADVNRGRFRREIQVAAQLQHPHIVPLLSAGEHENLLYFTMPFIAGESLKQSLERNGPMLVPDVVRVLYHVGEALDYAHGQGVVHRDIKPANILRSGTYALVTDFGVAKALNAAMAQGGMTSTGMAIGTPAYMSPEQLAGDPAADFRVDIYALGLLAYELLNGRSPFAASTPQRVLAAVLTQDAPPLIDVRPDVPRRLSELVMSCLSKDPDGRPPSARAVLAALDGFSTGSGQIKTSEYKVPRVEKTTPAEAPAMPVSSTPVTNTPVTNTPVTNTAVTNTPVTNTPVSNTPVINRPVSLTPAAEQPAVNEELTPTAEAEALSYDPPRKSGKGKLYAGLVVVLALVAGGIFITTRGSSDNAVPANATTAVTDSAKLQPAPGAVATLPAATTESAVVAAPKLDSQAIADSIKQAAAAKKAAAKADSLRKVAAAADSAKRAQGSNKTKARSAVIWMLADANARQAFNDGATHMGGLLKKKRMGDLQTQISTLQPFLTRAGLTYDQFKAVMQESGTSVYDEFGRMVPDSLAKFTGVNFGSH
jgi:serine/threonine protein kinase